MPQSLPRVTPAVPLTPRPATGVVFQDRLFTLICVLSGLMGISILGFILFSLVAHGWHAMTFSMFTHRTLPNDLNGGLGNAILGSLLMVSISMLISIPIGVGAAVYLTQYQSKGRLNKLIRFCNDSLLSTPSIAIGLFIFSIFVKPFHQFSAVAGSMALALISLPMIFRTTEDMLYLVSPLLNESALALGVPSYKVINRILLRCARSGIVTGALLALARIAGETAPLLFTSLSNDYYSIKLTGPMASLPVIIYQYAMSPYQHWQALAWSGALLVTLFILLANLAARFFSSDRKRQ